MKNLMYILCLFVGTVSTAAQTISLSRYTLADLKPNIYLKDTDGILDPFVGTWIFKNETIEFTVKFVKMVNFNPANLNEYTQDQIIGGYRNVRNGEIIVDKLAFKTDFNPNDISTFKNFAPIISNISPPFIELSLIISDELNRKRCSGYFKLINSQEAEWTLFERETIKMRGEESSIQGFSIPSNTILKKIAY